MFANPGSRDIVAFLVFGVSIFLHDVLSGANLLKRIGALSQEDAAKEQVERWLTSAFLVDSGLMIAAVVTRLLVAWAMNDLDDLGSSSTWLALLPVMVPGWWISLRWLADSILQGWRVRRSRGLAASEGGGG